MYSPAEHVGLPKRLHAHVGWTPSILFLLCSWPPLESRVDRHGATTGDSQTLTNSVLERALLWLRKEYPWHPLARTGKAT
jgi:hypothetical protein